MLRRQAVHVGKVVNVIGRRIREGKGGAPIHRGGDGEVAILSRHGVAQQASPATNFSFYIEGLFAQNVAVAGVAIAEPVSLDSADAASPLGFAILLKARGVLLLQ
jgi:hypothetical protein